MEKNKIKEKIQEILKDRLDIVVQDPDENFFSRNLNIFPMDMVCLLYEFSELFQVSINDNFIENLPSITLNNLAETIFLSTV